MFHYEVSRRIAAAPETVWAILTDAGTLQQGFGITRIEGRIAPGAKLRIWSDVSPGRAFPVRVATLTAPTLMVWEGGMPFGLFRGRRSFRLTGTTGGTEFTKREEFSGPLAGLIRRSMPDLNPSFATFADALQRKAQS
jgi:hypothetical protein